MTDADYLRRCYDEAARWSADPVTQNAAVLVWSGHVLATAANGVPPGVKITPERLERPHKYKFFAHAERRAIYRAAKYGNEVDGATLYCPWSACSQCAIAIIESGVRAVVGHRAPFHATRDDWRDDLDAAAAMLAEAGVETRWVEGHLGATSILFDGQRVNP